MHYILILAVLVAICLANAGHADKFEAAYQAALRGDLGHAASLTSVALRQSLRDADPEKDGDKRAAQHREPAPRHDGRSAVELASSERDGRGPAEY
jgi:hypothetical protein